MSLELLIGAFVSQYFKEALLMFILVLQIETRINMKRLYMDVEKQYNHIIPAFTPKWIIRNEHGGRNA